MDARIEIWNNMVDVAPIEFLDSQKPYILEAMQRYADNELKSAFRWIPIDEETPIAFETGDWDGKRSDFVLGKSNKGVCHIVRAYKGFMDGSSFCEFCNKDDTVINIVEWRPIERV